MAQYLVVVHMNLIASTGCSSLERKQWSLPLYVYASKDQNITGTSQVVALSRSQLNRRDLAYLREVELMRLYGDFLASRVLMSPAGPTKDKVMLCSVPSAGSLQLDSLP
ncbi:hypothetical protein MRB53_037505 [Persea americana]|nr:hypothetical protein MRB53_037505 [Persea americana]